MPKEITYEIQEILNTLEVLGDFSCKRTLCKDDQDLIQLLLRDAAFQAPKRYVDGLNFLANNLFIKLNR